MSPDERLERWRLVLGKPAQHELGVELSGSGLGRDRVMEALYDADSGSGVRGYGKGKKAGRGQSNPHVNRWLGDIRKYFPKPVVRVMQKDALDRLNLTEMFLQPETLNELEADVHLVATLLSLKSVIPEETKSTAHTIVQKVVDDLMKQLDSPMRQAIRGSLDKANRNYRPRGNEIDWDRTIRLNLKNYQPDRKTIIAERLVGYSHKRNSLRDIVLCVDQSGSMATSVVYSAIFGAVLATLPAVSTQIVVFDTAVVDLTKDLKDPVDLLFGTQLGGGTDINKAVGYCQKIIARPSETIFVLLTDLYEFGDVENMFKRIQTLKNAGVQIICLLALSDDGAPSYDERNASRLADIGVESFACTPDLFPDLMAAAIQKKDIRQWAARNEIVTQR